MPQAYFTSPKRGQESPPGHKKSPRTHRSGRSSKITSPTPLSPTELANYILERGNTVTSPIIAKMVLDQHLDSRALAEFADESDSEEQFTSLSVLGNKDLAEDFLKTTSPLRHKLPPLDVTRSVRPSLMEIASLLEHAEFTAVSPASTAPAFMTPLLSPSIPEWDLEDPNSPEDLEIFAPMQSAMDDSDDDDLLHSPGLRNFRVSGPPSSDDLRGVYSSLLRPAVPPFTPETMPLLSALDMHQPYGISPSSSQGGADGLGDPPGHIQADLLNRRRSPGDDGEVPQTSVVEEAQEPSAPRMSRATSKMSMFGTDSITQPHSRPSSCPPRADRPRIIIPDTFWQPPPRRPPPQRIYAEVGVQTEVIEVPVVVDQPASHPVEVASDAEETSFFDARSTPSTTESVRDTDEETDDFHDPSQSGGEEHVSAPTTPRQPLKAELAGEVPTPRASTPAAPAPTALPATNPHIQRLKSENATSSSSPTAPPLVRTTSEPVKQSPSGKHQNRPSLDIKAVHSSVKGSASQGPRSAPVAQSTPALPSRSSVRSNSHTTRRSGQTQAKAATTNKPATHSGRATQGSQSRKQAETAEPSRAVVTNQNAAAKGAKSGQTKDLSTQSHSASHVETPSLPSIDTPKQATDVITDATQDIDGAQQDEHREATGSSSLSAPGKGEVSETMLSSEDTNDESSGLAIAASEPEKESLPDTTVASQESTATTSAVPGEGEQGDQQAAGDEEASRTKSGKEKEVEDNNVSTPKPPVKVQLLVGATTGSGETTPANELSSEAQEQVDSALSSSILPESTSSEGVPSSESAEEHTDAEKRSVVVDEKSTTSQPSSASTTVDSTATKPGTTSSSDEAAAGSSGAVANQDTPDPTKSSNTDDVTSPTLPEQTISEGYTHIERSDVNEPFESIDMDEAKCASKQAGGDDNGDPKPVQDADASAVAAASSGTTDEAQEDGDDTENSADAILENQQPMETKAAAKLEPAGHAASVELSNLKETQVDAPALEASFSPLENSAQPSTSSSGGATSVQSPQPTESDETEPNLRLENPAISRVHATGPLERDTSQATDLQTEDGGDLSHADGGEDNSGKPLTKSQKKRLKEKEREKKKQEATAKKVAEKAEKELREKEALEQKAAEEDARKAALKETARKQREDEEAAKQKVARLEAEADAATVKAKEQVEKQKVLEAERKRVASAENQRPATQLHRGADANLPVQPPHRQDRVAQQLHLPVLQTQTQPPVRVKRTMRDLELGGTSSPIPSPGPRVRSVPPDIESQGIFTGSPSQRDSSPSSTHSKGSGWSSLFKW